MRNFRIITAHALDALRGLQADSVHCVATSPPYWGLRDYGLEPMVWASSRDASPKCSAHNHEWSASAAPGGNGTGMSFRRDRQAGRNRGGAQPGFCRHCSAWRGSLGLEPNPELYVEHMVSVFREVRRVLRPDGVCFLNLGDSYTSGGRSTYRSGASDNKGHQIQDDQRRPDTPPGLKPKDLCMLPARVALALQADGWWLRSEIVWHKPNPMPESVKDRPTKAHEMVYLLTKSPKYFWDAEAVREPHLEVSLMRARRKRFGGKYQDTDPAEHGRLKAGANYGPTGDPDKVCSPGGRNLRTVWTIPTAPFPEAHFATFPPALVEPMIKAGSRPGDTVLDPFAGAGTTLLVAAQLGRDAIGIELNPDYAEMARRRVLTDSPPLNSEVLA